MKSYIVILFFCLALCAQDKNAKAIWDFFLGRLSNKYGVAGLMGNLKAESGFDSKNVQDSYNKKLKMDDDTYTSKVDDNTYKNFVRDAAGYGLAQWTYWARKQKLLEYAKSKNASIGDLNMQLEFLANELEKSYSGVWKILKNAKSVAQASNAVMLKFERPADQSSAAQAKRAALGEAIYKQFANSNGDDNKEQKPEQKPEQPSNVNSDSRKKVVAVMQGWVDIKKGSSGHKKIIDIYNTITPLPAGYKMNTSNAWCATTVSAAYKQAGLDSIFATECSCGRMVEKAKKMGIWQEDDAYVPAPGDCVLYHWKDNGKGDNKSWPDHVGMVEKVEGNKITVIEGNMGKPSHVGRRVINVNQKFIRGYVTPKF